MKKIFLLFTVVLLSLSLISCKKNKENVIVVGASSTPHAKILEQAKPMLEELGYTLEIKIIDDYKIPNSFLHQGSIDANYFQHLPFLNSYNKDNGTNLVSIGAIHYEPFGLYGNEITDLGQATKQILIPNDGSNRSRALLLLEQAGLIILRSGIDPTGEITQKDIVNFNGFEITELAAENIASSLRFSEKGTLGVVNGNYALSSGLNIADALATEDANGAAAQTYANIIAVRSESQNDPKILALLKVLKSKEIADYINNTFNGAVKPVN